MQFEIGDVVQLMSGSPLMTVTYVSSETNKITCTWHSEGVEEPKWHEYPAAALKKFVEPEKRDPTQLGAEVARMFRK